MRETQSHHPVCWKIDFVGIHGYKHQRMQDELSIRFSNEYIRALFQIIPSALRRYARRLKVMNRVEIIDASSSRQPDENSSAHQSSVTNHSPGIAFCFLIFRGWALVIGRYWLEFTIESRSAELRRAFFRERWTDLQVVVVLQWIQQTGQTSLALWNKHGNLPRWF